MSRGPTHEQQRDVLVAAHGEPRPVPAGPALVLIGRRGEVHPRDAKAFAYRDEAAARAWTTATAVRHGLGCLGTARADGPLVVGVYDLRPVLGVDVTDPGLPDDWTPRGGRA